MRRIACSAESFVTPAHCPITTVVSLTDRQIGAGRDGCVGIDETVYCERWRVGAPPDPRTGLSPTQNGSNVHPAFLCLSCGSQALEE